MNLSDQIHPVISVIVPVYREQEAINYFAQQLLKIFSGPGYEIIIVDGSPEQESISALNVSGITAVSSDKGRGRQMNVGASMARGQILLFLHSDTLLPDNAPDLIINALLSERSILGGAFSLRIDSKKWALKLIEFMANIRSLMTRVPYGDQAIFIRKDIFHKIGGFREIPVMEDLELMTRIKKQGNSIVILPQKAVTSARRWEKEGISRCTLRNWFIRVLYHLGVPAEKVGRFYS